MASFFAKLFGFGGGDGAQAAASGKTEPYNDVVIRATPMREGGQYRLAGSIEKDVGGTVRARHYIRADVFQSETEATDAALRKGRQIVDQSGPALFADDVATRQV
ncbi:HlyU family transcriptional regulator [Ensifer soli]|uniref:HlyU family transcriptional regulator n=1 Tax=Ciceribacter sp. sgz301302 TaxID=3342379 RepID=UPI0035B77388